MPHALGKQCIVLATLAGYLWVAIGGVGVVFCQGSDGHSGIEVAHQHGHCGAGHAQHSPAPQAPQVTTAPSCHDTPLEELALANPISPRAYGDAATLLPRPLLREAAWTDADRQPYRKVDRTAPQLTPSHLDAVQCVVLLI
ncbi:MAG: hypothetical protein WD294_14685 [Phycisphaeraceae bacterium]